MTRFTDLDDLLRQAALGTSAWQLVDQDRIDRFAEVTGDGQWIHTDPERAREEGPFGGTVAHGALTLSLCMAFMTEVVQVDTVTMVVNGGFDKVRFQAPVPAGSRLRGIVTLREARRIDSGARIVVRNRVEIEGVNRPACIADQILALYTAREEH
jgi:acyl dehydratase